MGAHFRFLPMPEARLEREALRSVRQYVDFLAGLDDALAWLGDESRPGYLPYPADSWAMGRTISSIEEQLYREVANENWDAATLFRWTLFDASRQEHSSGPFLDLILEARANVDKFRNDLLKQYTIIRLFHFHTPR
jgi:hypothetical protein